MTKQPNSAAPGGEAVRLERAVEALPRGLDALRAEAHAEGHRHLERLAADWDSGLTRFDRDGEALLAAFVENELVGIGGLTMDPVLPESLRMRRFYIGRAFRRCGIGRRLAAALLDGAVRACRPVTVNAATGSAPFWESLGFLADMRDGRTHLLKRTGKTSV
jgi:GNAT superfamily N-acetyltransferase